MTEHCNILTRPITQHDVYIAQAAVRFATPTSACEAQVTAMLESLGVGGGAAFLPGIIGVRVCEVLLGYVSVRCYCGTCL